MEAFTPYSGQVVENRIKDETDEVVMRSNGGGRVRLEKKSKVNNKERRRNNELNKAFDRLQSLIPFISTHQEQKLSKIKTLRLANYYIRFLKMVLSSAPTSEDGDGDPTLNAGETWNNSPLAAFFPFGIGGKTVSECRPTLEDFASVVATEIQTKNSYKHRADQLVTSSHSSGVPYPVSAPQLYDYSSAPASFLPPSSCNYQTVGGGGAVSACFSSPPTSLHPPPSSPPHHLIPPPAYYHPFYHHTDAPPPFAAAPSSAVPQPPLYYLPAAQLDGVPPPLDANRHATN